MAALQTDAVPKGCFCGAIGYIPNAWDTYKAPSFRPRVIITPRANASLGGRRWIIREMESSEPLILETKH